MSKLKNTNVFLLIVGLIIFSVSILFVKSRITTPAIKVSLRTEGFQPDELSDGEFVIENLTDWRLRDCHLTWASSTDDTSPLENPQNPTTHYPHFWPAMPFAIDGNETVTIPVGQVRLPPNFGSYTTYYQVRCVGGIGIRPITPIISKTITANQ